MKELNGMTALITGGSKGIGYGIAASLLKEGVNVAITSRDQKSADAAVRELSKTGPGKVIGIAADVRDFDSQKNAVAKTLEAFGRLDVLIANAGVGHFASITDLTPSGTSDSTPGRPFNVGQKESFVLANRNLYRLPAFEPLAATPPGNGVMTPGTC